jgi:hypothetical protein
MTDKTKKEIGAVDRNINSVTEKKVKNTEQKSKRYTSPYGVVYAESNKEAEEKIIKLKEKLKKKLKK